MSQSRTRRTQPDRKDWRLCLSETVACVSHCVWGRWADLSTVPFTASTNQSESAEQATETSTQTRGLPAEQHAQALFCLDFCKSRMKRCSEALVWYCKLVSSALRGHSENMCYADILPVFISVAEVRMFFLKISWMGWHHVISGNLLKSTEIENGKELLSFYRWKANKFIKRYVERVPHSCSMNINMCEHLSGIRQQHDETQFIQSTWQST